MESNGNLKDTVINQILKSIYYYPIKIIFMRELSHRVALIPNSIYRGKELKQKL
jgi:hypothetical protein